MPLNGTGSILGSLLSSAVGAPPVAGEFFGNIGSVIASWGLTNIVVRPGKMKASGASVVDPGAIDVIGGIDELGLKLAEAIGSTDEGNVEKWTVIARGLKKHLEEHGSVDPALFTIANPTSGGPIAGTGALKFDLPSFVPPLAEQLGLSDPGNLLALGAFNVALLNHLQANASIVPVSIVDPFVPLTAPAGGGPITGAGSIT